MTLAPFDLDALADLPGILPAVLVQVAKDPLVKDGELAERVAPGTKPLSESSIKRALRELEWAGCIVRREIGFGYREGTGREIEVQSPPWERVTFLRGKPRCSRCRLPAVETTGKFVGRGTGELCPPCKSIMREDRVRLNRAERMARAELKRTGKINVMRLHLKTGAPLWSKVEPPNVIVTEGLVDHLVRKGVLDGDEKRVWLQRQRNALRGDTEGI